MPCRNPRVSNTHTEDLDPKLCTHVIFAFAKLTGNNLEAFEWNDEDTDWSQGMYSRMMALKRQNSQLKVLLAVGGWNVGAEPFSKIVHNEDSRKAFIKQSVQFLLDHKFDGLDLDWEYPGSRSGSQPTDKPLFTILCKEFNEALKPHGLLLTAAVGMGIETIEKAYEIAEISTYLDWINMMAYDLHGAWEKFVGHNAPLYARKDETGYQATLNVNHTVSYWLEHGAPAKKLVLGLGTYGRAFTLAESSDFLPGTTAKNPGEKGKYTREAGFLSYYEICEKIDKENWNVEWDSEAMVPYAHQGLNWVGYDNKESLEIKVQYAKKLGLGGIMFWSLALDDFTGNFCGEGKYPLLNAAVEALNNDKNDTPEELNQQIQVNTDTKTTRNQAIYTATSKPTETTKSLIDVLCSNGNGYYLDRADDCSGYYVCLFIGTPNAQIKKLKCPDGLHFDESKSVCAHADSFNCDLKTSTKMTTRKATTVTTTTKTTAETTTTKKSTTKLIEILNKNVKCPNGNGFYTDRAANCYRYYFCAMANTPDEIIQYFSCQGDMKYNENTKKCDTNVYDC